MHKTLQGDISSANERYICVRGFNHSFSFGVLCHRTVVLFWFQLKVSVSVWTIRPTYFRSARRTKPSLTQIKHSLSARPHTLTTEPDSRRVSAHCVYWILAALPMTVSSNNAAVLVREFACMCWCLIYWHGVLYSSVRGSVQTQRGCSDTVVLLVFTGLGTHSETNKDLFSNRYFHTC